jgi:hypothetical protein
VAERFSHSLPYILHYTMRIVSKKIAVSFENNRSRKVGNTHTDGQSVFLYGNKIIERREDGSVWVSLAGWNTPTTRSRINDITGAGFSQKDFTPYLRGEPVDSREWYPARI